MKKSPREILASEVVGQVSDLILERERASTAEEFDEITRLILEQLGRLGVPTAGELQALRKPWLRIIDHLLTEIDIAQHASQYRFGLLRGSQVLFIDPRLTMAALTRSQWMLVYWNEIPIRTSRELKKQLLLADVVLTDDRGKAKPFGDDICVILSKVAKHGLTFAAMQQIQTSKPLVHESLQSKQ